MEKWEQYESGRGKVLEAIKKAESDLSRSPTPGGQEAIHRDLTNKQVGYSYLVDKRSYRGISPTNR